METKKIKIGISAGVLLGMLIIAGLIIILLFMSRNFNGEKIKYQAQLDSNNAKYTALVNGYVRLSNINEGLVAEVTSRKAENVLMQQKYEIVVKKIKSMSRDSANNFVIGEYNVPKDSVHLGDSLPWQMAQDLAELDYLRALTPNLDSIINDLEQSLYNKDKMLTNLNDQLKIRTNQIIEQDGMINRLERQRKLLIIGGVTAVVLVAIL